MCCRRGCALTLVVVCGVCRAGRRLASICSSAEEGAPFQEESPIDRAASNSRLSRSQGANGAAAALSHPARSPRALAQRRSHPHHHHTTTSAERVVLFPKHINTRPCHTQPTPCRCAPGGRSAPTEGGETRRVRCAAAVAAGECASGRRAWKDALRQHVIRFRRSTSRRTAHAHFACTTHNQHTTQARRHRRVRTSGACAQRASVGGPPAIARAQRGGRRVGARVVGRVRSRRSAETAAAATQQLQQPHHTAHSTHAP